MNSKLVFEPCCRQASLQAVALTAGNDEPAGAESQDAFCPTARQNSDTKSSIRPDTYAYAYASNKLILNAASGAAKDRSAPHPQAAS